VTGYGVATSAFQIEGAVDADGRGPSTWDEFCTRPGAIKDGTDAVIACDSYHRFDEDLALLVDLGVDAYRFSIAWPRIQPTGRGPVNEPGLAYYDRIVDALLDRDIRPFPTLFHWDLPLALEQAGGWPARDTAYRFVEYAQLVTERLSDRITTWATHNEPWCTAMLGHAAGVFAPGNRDRDKAYDAAHHLLLSHAMTKQALPDLNLGIVLNLTVVRTERDGDPGAADVVDAWQNRLWLDALADGRYPAVLGDPEALEDGDLEAIEGSADWLGINYYTPFRIGPVTAASDAVGQDVDAFPGSPPFAFAPRGPVTTMGWEVDPTGLAETIRMTAGRLPDLPLRITENGIATSDDEERIAYLKGHLAAVEQVQEEGIDVRDYFAWSLLDNFEWAQGWTQDFGLVAVDRATLERTPKPSFHWYREHIAAR
jgi:beta-glucosidase